MGLANTRTRFGKFIQAAAATTIEEKLSDAAEVHRLTGCCPTAAVHVLRDFQLETGNVREVVEPANKLTGALLLAKAADPQAKLLVDLGHHYSSQNIEQIVAGCSATICWEVSLERPPQRR